MEVPNYYKKAISTIIITITSIATEFNPILSPLWCPLQALINGNQCLWKIQTPCPPAGEKLRHRSCRLTQIQTEFLLVSACPTTSAGPRHSRWAAHTVLTCPRGCSLWHHTSYIFWNVSEFHGGAGKWKYPSESTSHAKIWSRRGDTM